MSAKQHIVIVTTWFPPISGVAVNRMLSFAKYLDHEKHKVSVLTLLTKGGLIFEEVHGCSVHRVKNKTSFKLPEFNAKDSFIRHKLKVLKTMAIKKIQKRELAHWQKLAEKKMMEIHQDQKVDLIISSFSPAEPHMVAANFVSTFKEVKWIADMRDEMSLNHGISSAQKAELLKVEAKVNELAAGVTTVSEPIVNYFKTLLPNISIVEEIRNGFDHEDIYPLPNSNNCFTICYCGSFYGKIKPDVFFKSLLSNKELLPKTWKVQFVGTICNFVIPRELKNNIEFIPRVPQSKSLNFMANADVNLLIHPIIDRKGIYTGKLFDYASVCKPILAIVDPNDVAAQLIKDLNLGFVASFDKPSEIDEALKVAINLWETKTSLDIDTSGVEKLHRRHQVKRLSTLIDQILLPN